MSAEHARASRRLPRYRELERDVEDLEPLAELAEEDPEIAQELEEQVRSVQARLDAARGAAAVLRPLRLGRRARHGQRRRRRHRRPGLGRDGAADGDALGREARLRRGAARGLAGGGGGDQVGHVPGQGRERLRPVRAARRAFTGWCGCRRSTPPTGARRASPASRSRRWSTDIDDVEIDDDDLQIDTYRASGAGGQHVNKTDSAVRITHKPTGIVVQCQNERSQSSNKAEAMTMLRSKLLELEERRRREEIAREKGEAQDVNFGSQIRSYVLHPYTMVKDHRTDYEMGDTTRVLDGDLDGFARAYLLKAAKLSGSRAGGSSVTRDDAAEQPTAPYLEAVTAYGFRGSLRFHVPGHKGGDGADPGPAHRARRARAAARRPARTSRASTSGRRRRRTSAPSDSPPRPTAPARTWFLTNGATQGNHALCLALAPARPARDDPAQLARQPDRRAGAERRDRASSSRPSTTIELGMAHGVTPEALAEALERVPGRPRRVHRLADLLRNGRRRRGRAPRSPTPPAWR